MKVHLYTVCWNEADMLPFFFRHYDSFVDRYVVFDNGSTDSSLDILNSHPRVELRKFVRTVPDSFVLSHRELQNRVWKESRGTADWVVMTAIDEHLEVKKGMGAYLSDCTHLGITLVPALGFQMLSNDMPATTEHLASTRTLGAPFDDMCKLSVFNPNAILDTNFGVGRHSANPVGILRLPCRDEVLLLHYKYLGFERTYKRHCALNEGLGSHDIAQNYGDQYRWSTEQFRKRWDRFLAQVVDVKDTAFNPSEIENLKRWWRIPALTESETRMIPTKRRTSRQLILSDLILKLESEELSKCVQKREEESVAKDRRIQELERVVERQKGSLQRAEIRIAGLLASKSWRLKARLRRIFSALLAVSTTLSSRGS